MSKYRLIRIVHDRCNEYSDTSYVGAEKGLSNDEIAAFCKAAREACLNAEQVAKKEAPPYPQEPSVRKVPPSTTAGELLEHFTREKAAYDEWQRQQNATKRTFEDWLREVSGGKIVSLYKATESAEEDNENELEVSWGHNHGMRVRYGTERSWKEEV